MKKYLIPLLIWCLFIGLSGSIIVSQGDGFLRGALKPDLSAIVVIIWGTIALSPFSLIIFIVGIVLFKTTRSFFNK